MCNAVRVVDAEYINRRSTNGCPPVEARSRPGEMIVPTIGSRVEQRDKRVCRRIVTSDIRPLGGIALRAAPAEVRNIRGPTMFPGTDMVDRVRQTRVRLRHAAIFTAVTSALPNDRAPCQCHTSRLRFWLEIAPVAPWPGSDRSTGRHANSDPRAGGRPA